MISRRTTHYVVWFLLLGVVVGLANLTGRAALGGMPMSELIWLFVIGGLGLLAGWAPVAGSVMRPFDRVVGAFFIAMGLLGVLHNFGIAFTTLPANPAEGDNTALLGLSLTLPFTLLHFFLGLTSLQQGLTSMTLTPSASTSTATPEA